MRSRDLKSVDVLEPARKVIREWSIEVRRELRSILVRLEVGEYVGMPDMKAMSSIGKGIFEIRLRSNEGSFRTFHLVTKESIIVIFHAFQKKSKATPRREIETARLRLKSYFRELG